MFDVHPYIYIVKPKSGNHPMIVPILSDIRRSPKIISIVPPAALMNFIYLRRVFE
jgi:hypothetical protein